MSSVILIIVALIFCYAIAWHDRAAVSSTVTVRKNSKPPAKPAPKPALHL